MNGHITLFVGDVECPLDKHMNNTNTTR